MIRSFGERGTEDLFNGRPTKHARAAVPKQLGRRALLKLEQLAQLGVEVGIGGRGAGLSTDLRREGGGPAQQDGGIPSLEPADEGHRAERVPGAHGVDEGVDGGGRLVMDAVRQERKPRDIVTVDALRNAAAVVTATAGSTNAVLHLMAIAHEAGVEIPLQELNEYSARTPHVCRMSPAAGGHHIEDLNRAGGIPAVMRRLLEAGLLEGEAQTATGKTVAEINDALRAKGIFGGKDISNEAGGLGQAGGIVDG